MQESHYAKRSQSRICREAAAASNADCAKPDWFGGDEEALAGSLTLRTRSMFLEASRQSATRMVTCSSGSVDLPNLRTSCVPVSSAGGGVAGGCACCCVGIWVAWIEELLAELSWASESKWNLQHRSESSVSCDEKPWSDRRARKQHLPDSPVEGFAGSFVRG
jgi:hypothetical protein